MAPTRRRGRASTRRSRNSRPARAAETGNERLANGEDSPEALTTGVFEESFRQYRNLPRGRHIRFVSEPPAPPLPVPEHSRVAEGTSAEQSERRSRRAHIASKTRECVICAEKKRVKKYFTKQEEACDHFADICNDCVAQMLIAAISERKFDSATLSCPFPCPVILDYHGVKKRVKVKKVFEAWDDALTSSLLRTDDEYITCLNSTCGHYFSKGPCEPLRLGKKTKIKCPYCAFPMCSQCGRPWHAEKPCDLEDNAGEESFQAAMKDLGIKLCPKCNTKIEKNGGCNHITCEVCKWEFCFDCLVPFADDMTHAEGCQSSTEGFHMDMDDPEVLEALDSLLDLENDANPEAVLAHMNDLHQQWVRSRQDWERLELEWQQWQETHQPGVGPQ